MTDTEKVFTLVDLARRVLAGHSAEIQGAVLADLLAIWLAGHSVEHDDPATAKLREEILELHLAAVRRLIPENEKIIKNNRNA